MASAGPSSSLAARPRDRELGNSATQLIALCNRLRDAGIETLELDASGRSRIELPRIIVVGNQSVGEVRIYHQLLERSLAQIHVLAHSCTGGKTS